MLASKESRLRAVLAAVAPAVMLAGYLYHPPLPYLPNPAAVAAAASSDTMRWAIAHLAVGLGSGLLMIAFLAIHGHLAEAAHERPGPLALRRTSAARLHAAPDGIAVSRRSEPAQAQAARARERGRSDAVMGALLAIEGWGSRRQSLEAAS